MAIDDIKRKVLVTGGAGFIGSRLVHALLERKLSVKVLDVQKGPFREQTENVELVSLGNHDVTGGMVNRDVVKRAVEDVDVIYHLAINWNGHTWRHVLPVADLFDVNVRGTLNLLEEARSRGVKQFLFASSIAVYGDENTEVTDEGTVCKPELWNGDPGPAYGILKLTTEKLCLMYNHHYGLPVTTFRIDLVFADDEDMLVSREMVHRTRKGGTIEASETEGSTSIHVDEVVQAFLLATLNKKAYGQVFNLTNPNTFISDYELQQFLVDTTGSDARVRLIKRPKPSGSALSIENAKRILGWEPQKHKEDRKNAIFKSIRLLIEAH